MARKRSQKKSSMVTTPHVGAQKGLGVRTVTKTGIQESDKENFPVELPPRDSLDYMRLRRKFNVHSRDDIECLSSGGSMHYPVYGTGIRYFQNGCLVNERQFYSNAGSRSNPNVYEYYRYSLVGEALHFQDVSEDPGYLTMVESYRPEIEKCIVNQSGPAFREVVCLYHDDTGSRFPEAKYEGYREYYPV